MVETATKTAKEEEARRGSGARSNTMSMPVTKEEVESALRPWLGTLFLSSNNLSELLCERMERYTPYRQTLESLSNELEVLLLTKLNALTNRTLTVVADNYHSRRLGKNEMADMTDALMGLIFEKMTPFSANFVKLNDYSMRVASLSALRVLYQKYRSFYQPEEFAFLVHIIKSVYSEEQYKGWLHEEPEEETE